MTKEKTYLISYYFFSILVLILGVFPDYFSIPNHLSLGFFCAGVAGFIFSTHQTKRLSSFTKNPIKYDIEKREKVDERNNLIIQYSKAKTFDISFYLFLATLLGFIILNEFEVVLVLSIFYLVTFLIFLWNISNQQRNM